MVLKKKGPYRAFRPKLSLPSDVKKVFHPIICCALSADLAALVFGYLSQSGIYPVLGSYLTKVSTNPGVGEILMGFLGSVIIFFAFSMFKQRKLVRRHAAEILTSVIISTIFSIQLLSLAVLLGANTSLTAAVVVLTGLVGVNFVQTMLDKLQFRDPIACGLATASSARGLGTAAEPEALPFCAIALLLLVSLVL